MKITLKERLEWFDPVGTYESTRDGLHMLTHMLWKLRNAAESEVEKEYWQARMDSAERENAMMESTWSVAQFVALQDRWDAEIDQVRRYRESLGQ